MTAAPRPGPARLTIDLRAVVANWRQLCRLAGGARVAAVVKADAYGLGVDRVALALARAGCRDFFVARLGEGVALRSVLPGDARILVLDGLATADVHPFIEHRLVPVLNSLEDVEAWAGVGRRPAALHVDTGMCRLGMSADDARRLAGDGLDLVLVMSHLACAEDTAHPLNLLQLERFRELAALFPGVPRSLANSSGMFLGAGWHLDLCRPGVALYGVNPTPGRPNPMLPVVRLEAPILQRHDIAEVGTVGYGATRAVWPGERIATVPVGYADGFPRSVGAGWSAKLLGWEVPLAGRVSMDTLCLDVSAVPPDLLAGQGATVELIGGPDGVDRLAAAAGTIGYEILTRLGRRYERVYLDEDGSGTA